MLVKFYGRIRSIRRASVAFLWPLRLGRLLVVGHYKEDY